MKMIILTATIVIAETCRVCSLRQHWPRRFTRSTFLPTVLQERALQRGNPAWGPWPAEFYNLSLAFTVCGFLERGQRKCLPTWR